jgi:hypothetical protein
MRMHKVEKALDKMSIEDQAGLLDATIGQMAAQHLLVGMTWDRLVAAQEYMDDAQAALLTNARGRLMQLSDMMLEVWCGRLDNLERE